MKIVIDAMGGDNAPQATVEGAVQAINEYGIDIILTGDKEQIEKELESKAYDKNKLEIIHTTQIIENEDKPVMAVRRKKDSSMVVALNLVKEKKADAIVSAGSTGALPGTTAMQGKCKEWHAEEAGKTGKQRDHSADGTCGKGTGIRPCVDPGL